MNIEARRAYLRAVKERYKNSEKKQKTQILNEFCIVCDYSRKHAIRLFADDEVADGIVPLKRPPGAPPKYSQAARDRLIELWQLMRYPCSVNLKQALSLWLPYDLESSEEIKKELLAMGVSTIERALSETKNKRPKGKSGTKTSSFKSQIPLKLCKEDDKKAVGYFEADTVAHCGDSLSGQFAWTLTMTDLHTGWTENRACYSKNAEDVKNGIEEIERFLPFRIMGFSSDNGTEFLNKTLQDYLTKDRSNVLDISRGRPYKKNDNAHVEQKNFTHVRNLFGYERLEGQLLVDLMNEIYTDYWNPLKNFYSPCLKLKMKERVGSKIKKKYDKPQTPYQRLIDSRQLTMKQEEDLMIRKSKLNPFTLQKKLNEKLKEFYRILDSSRLRPKSVA